MVRMARSIVPHLMIMAEASRHWYGIKPDAFLAMIACNLIVLVGALLTYAHDWQI